MITQSGGKGFGEGPRQLAVFFISVLLAIFFLLVLRTLWDQMHGGPGFSFKGSMSQCALRSEVLKHR